MSSILIVTLDRKLSARKTQLQWSYVFRALTHRDDVQSFTKYVIIKNKEGFKEYNMYLEKGIKKLCVIRVMRMQRSTDVGMMINARANT